MHKSVQEEQRGTAGMKIESVWTAVCVYVIISSRYQNHYENGGFLYVFKRTA